MIAANSKTMKVENDQITLSPPQGMAMFIRWLDDDTVRVDSVREEDLPNLMGDEEAQIQFTGEALRFSEEQGIRGYVETALQAAREVFGKDRQVRAVLKTDEYGDRYVDIHVVLHDEEPETEAQKYSDCVEKWAPLVPPNLGGLIQLSTSWKQ